jgi:CheY-like chemotaxis protein
MAEILLVDDDSNVRLTLAIALRRRGHTVTMVADGYNALDQLKRQPFQFLISDVRMPGMSGFDLARQAQLLPVPPRVILTSAYSNIGSPEGIIEAFLQKPVDIGRLDELLKTAPPPNAPDNLARAQAYDAHHDGVPKQFRPAFLTGQ